MSITDELRTGGIYKFPSESRLFTEEELTAIVDRIDETVASEYVRLPRDSDGVPIHIGDRLVEPEYVPNGGTVVGIKRYVGWDHCLVNCGAWVDPRKCRHYHKPTVEDVLREFADDVRKERVELATISDGTITEYAEKLREVVEHDRD